MHTIIVLIRVLPATSNEPGVAAKTGKDRVGRYRASRERDGRMMRNRALPPSWRSRKTQKRSVVGQVNE
jgi:hypothetical protein